IMQLSTLKKANLIEKHEYPKFGWCNMCDLYGDINVTKSNEFIFHCSGCGHHSFLTNETAVEYFSKFNLIGNFLHLSLSLFSSIETIVDGRLVYIGQKEQTNYYLFRAMYYNDTVQILNRIKSNYPVYVFCLGSRHSIKAPKFITLINLIDCLTVAKG